MDNCGTGRTCYMPSCPVHVSFLLHVLLRINVFIILLVNEINGAGEGDITEPSLLPCRSEQGSVRKLALGPYQSFSEARDKIRSGAHLNGDNLRISGPVAACLQIRDQCRVMVRVTSGVRG